MPAERNPVRDRRVRLRERIELSFRPPKGFGIELPVPFEVERPLGCLSSRDPLMSAVERCDFRT